MIKMCKFCGSEPLQRQPIYHNGLTFCSNGHYVLRFTGRLEGAADVTEGSRSMAAFMESLFPRPDELAEMRHVPHLVDQATVTQCEECRGYGATKPCQHCEGTGIVKFEKDFYTYECECQSCNGNCKVHSHIEEAGAERCSLCQGFGDETDEWCFSRPVHLGKARLSLDQMYRLSRLPMIAWAAYGIHGHFVFSGGDGVLLSQQTPPEERCI